MYKILLGYTYERMTQHISIKENNKTTTIIKKIK